MRLELGLWLRLTNSNIRINNKNFFDEIRVEPEGQKTIDRENLRSIYEIRTQLKRAKWKRDYNIVKVLSQLLSIGSSTTTKSHC